MKHNWRPFAVAKDHHLVIDRYHMFYEHYPIFFLIYAHNHLSNSEIIQTLDYAEFRHLVNADILNPRQMKKKCFPLPSREFMFEPYY